MKKNTGILVIIFIMIIGCSQNPKTKVECENPVSLGDIKICLPTIDGMTECHTNVFLKKRISESNPNKDSVLAYYLNDSTYKKVDKISEILYDDYFVIFSKSKSIGKKFVESDLNMMANLMEGSYIKENWDDIKKKVETNFDYLSVDTPILIDSYIPAKQVRTFVLLMKFLSDDNEWVQIIIMNLVQIQERFITAVYYKFYDTEETIRKAKAKNDYVLLKLTDMNK